MRSGPVCAGIILTLSGLFGAGLQAAEEMLPEDARAGAVVRAFEADDEAAVGTLAAQDDLDPWLVAEALCREGAFDAAQAFAEGAPRPDTKTLPAWVKRQASGTATPQRVLDALRTASFAIARGQNEAALEALARHVETREDYVGARVLRLRGFALEALGRPKEAVDCHLKAADRAEAAGWLRGAAGGLYSAGEVSLAFEAYEDVFAYWQRELQVNLLRELPVEAAATRMNLGLFRCERGEFLAAIELLTPAEETLAEHGVAGYQASTLEGLGLAHMGLGRFAAALGFHERALEVARAARDSLAVALNLAYIGVLHELLGAYERAETALVAALVMLDPERDAPYYALAKGNLGTVFLRTGREAEAKDAFEEAREIYVRLGDVQRIAAADEHLGRVCYALGEFPAAEAHYENAQAGYARSADAFGTGSVLWQLGDLCARPGSDRVAEGQAAYREAIDHAREWGLGTIEVRARKGLARSYLRQKQYGDALREAREGVERLRAVVVGLGSHHAAVARADFSDLFRCGARAALELDSAADAYYFLESGRSGALLESLEARRAIREFRLPEALRREEQRARDEVAEADLLVRRARKTGSRPLTRARRDELAAAQGRLLDVVGRIERKEKAAAHLMYPSAAALDDVQAGLAPDDALVLVGLYDSAGIAVVITREDARVVPLGDGRKLEALVDAIDPNEEGAYGDKTIADLRRHIVAPLGLGEDVRRVLVSPSGALFRLPLGLLFEPRRVVAIPSATIHGLLAARPDGPGKKALALGDVDYSTYRYLGALPDSRKEAEAVGDVVLLQGEATEVGFLAALRKEHHWKAVHLACHGVTDCPRPFDAYLALTQGATLEQGDGRLTALELLRIRLPTDLVVLSACGSGRGVVVKGEGMLGLVRAVMVAGAPRVVVNLWNADDEAALVFMKAFYRLRAEPGTTTADALAGAQAEVRLRPAWEDPYFWAGWTLWGAAD